MSILYKNADYNGLHCMTYVIFIQCKMQWIYRFAAFIKFMHIIQSNTHKWHFPRQQIQLESNDIATKSKWDLKWEDI